MKVTSQSCERLELEHRPISWIVGMGITTAMLLLFTLKALIDGEFGGVAIAGLMTLAIDWVWLTQAFVTVRLNADRASDRLKITTTSAFGENFRERALADLTGAEVDTRYCESSSSAKTALVLRFGSERHPIQLFKPDPADLLQAATAINTWLGQAQTTNNPSGDEQP
ncbi:MAG: hypothetical protein ACOC0Q_07420 [Wenzhouxiangella sp.]